MKMVAYLEAVFLLVICVASNGEAREPKHSDLGKPDLADAWNQRVLEIAAAEDHFLTLKGVRTASIMHLAMHDALNAVRPVYSSYAYRTLSKDSDPIAAATQAAYEVAVSQYPKQDTLLREELRKWLRVVPDTPAKGRGIALGKATAVAVLASREGDGWDTQVEYRFQPMGPGVYAEFREHSGTPEGFVFGAGWAKARPFVLRAPDQFRVLPPPDIRSAEYVKAFNEVKEVGAFQSRTRSKDQTHIALWWKDFCDNSMNRLARQLIESEQLNLWAATRLFALVNIDIYDGYVSVFEEKFFYNHWRPYTAIRWAAHDGNPETLQDNAWDNTHRHTYAFPSYPSAHGTVCAATLTTFAREFGDRYPFTMTTAEVNAAGPFSPVIRMNPATRSFASFSDAAIECAVSRVYLGIHFRYDAEVGNQLGKQIGAYIWDNALRPL
jgi:hypothetical protein